MSHHPHSNYPGVKAKANNLGKLDAISQSNYMLIKLKEIIIIDEFYDNKANSEELLQVTKMKFCFDSTPAERCFTMCIELISNPESLIKSKIPSTTKTSYTLYLVWLSNLN